MIDWIGKIERFFCRVAAYLNKALHRAAIPVRSIAAGELGHYVELK